MDWLIVKYASRLRRCLKHQYSKEKRDPELEREWQENYSRNFSDDLDDDGGEFDSMTPDDFRIRTNAEEYDD